MRKTILVVASVALAMVVAGGVAWAATIQCPNRGLEGGLRICYGTDQDDTMLGTGTGRSDQMKGQAGNDTMYGYGELDFMSGDAGADTIYGGRGNDYLGGGSDGSGPGNDHIHGGKGNDHIYAGASEQTDSPDTVDRVYGERGNDDINVSQVDQMVYDGPWRPITKEVVYCGPGTDVVVFDRGVDVVKGNCERKIRGR